MYERPWMLQLFRRAALRFQDTQSLRMSSCRDLQGQLIFWKPTTSVRLPMQECKWEFLIFSGSFSAELTVKEERNQGRLTFSLIESSFMEEFVGRWKVLLCDFKSSAPTWSKAQHR